MSRIIFLVAVSHRWFWAGTAIVGPAVQLSATDHDLTAAFGAECQCSGEGAVQTAERCQPPSTNIHSPVMYPAWREQRKATVLPISSGVPCRSAGMQRVDWRSEERRVGKACVRPGGARCWRYP